MCAIPTSDLAGQKKLHERVTNALDSCQESESVDFKESAPWDALKWKIIQTMMAMGNLRDGGIVVIGVSERQDTWYLAGILPEHLSTYDVDIIKDALGVYCQPPPEVDVVRVRHVEQEFLAFQVHEFKNTPFVCAKNGPDPQGRSIVAGAFYVRPPGKAQTTRITDAAQMHELLELAAEKGARRILEVSRRVGLVPEAALQKRFDDELGGL